MPDLLDGNEPPITLNDQIKCIKREISMRGKVYPRWVEKGRLPQGEADREIETMKAVLHSMEAVVAWRRTYPGYTSPNTEHAKAEQKILHLGVPHV